jgi:nucleoside-diphosphate-sugar epimerase
MRIFVAGATGVIGRRVIPRLVTAGHQVTGAARTPENRTALERMGAASASVDLFAPATLTSALRGQEAVINLATHVPPSSRAFLPGAWRETDRIRRVGAANLMEAALAGGAKRFIQESFAPIYPDRGEEWIDESAPVRPARYNRGVIDAEAAAERFTASGRTGIALRFAFLYGADSDYTRDAIRLVRKGWAPTLGRPEGFISSVSHDDAAEAVVAAMVAGAGVYNAVDDEPMRRRTFFGTLAEALGVPAPRLPPSWLARVTGSLGELMGRSQRISNRKLRTESGWAPRYPSMREGWGAVVNELTQAAKPSSDAGAV